MTASEVETASSLNVSYFEHAWPTDPDQHVWGPWLNKTGLPKPTQYRQCVHPACHATEQREAPKA